MGADDGGQPIDHVDIEAARSGETGAIGHGAMVGARSVGEAGWRGWGAHDLGHAAVVVNDGDEAGQCAAGDALQYKVRLGAGRRLAIINLEIEAAAGAVAMGVGRGAGDGCLANLVEAPWGRRAGDVAGARRTRWPGARQRGAPTGNTRRSGPIRG